MTEERSLKIGKVIAKNLDMLKDDAIPNTLHLQLEKVVDGLLVEAKREAVEEVLKELLTYETEVYNFKDPGMLVISKGSIFNVWEKLSKLEEGK